MTVATLPLRRAPARALALFDLDGTLLPHPSAEWRFVRELRRLHLLGWRRLGASVGFALRHAPREGIHVWKKNKAYLTGLRVDVVHELADRWVAQTLWPRVRASVAAQVRRHAAEGAHVILLTGTPEFIAEPLARRLGMAECIATRCAHRDGMFVAEPPWQHPFGTTKLDLAATRCRELGISLQDAWAYADSRHDLPLLSATRAVVVHPAPLLRRIARRRGWTVLEGE